MADKTGRSRKLLRIGGVVYRAGDRLWWKNQYGQQFRGVIARCWDGDKKLLFVVRDDCKEKGEQLVDPDGFAVSRIYKPSEEK